MIPSQSPAWVRVFGRARWQIAGAVICAFLVAECAARILVVTAHPPRAVVPEFDAKLVTARRPVGNSHQLAFIGGSFTKLAIYPELLQERLREKGIETFPKNLATVGSCVDEHLVMLNEVVSHSPVSPVIFYDLRQDAFLKHFQQNTKANNMDAFRDTYIGKKYYGATSLSQHIDQMAEDHLSLARDRKFLRDELFSSVGDVCDFDTEYDASFKPHPAASTDLSAYGTAAGYAAVTRSSLLKQISRTQPFMWCEWYGQEWSLGWFNKVKQYCSSHKLKLVLLWLPECNLGKSGLRDEELTHRYGQLADGKNIFFVDLHSIDTDPAHFHDPVHCNIAGAVVATEHLAKCLEQEPLRSVVCQQEESVQ